MTVLSIMICVHKQKEKINQGHLLGNVLEQFFGFDEKHILMPLKICTHMHQLTTCTPYATVHTMQRECSSCK